MKTYENYLDRVTILDLENILGFKFKVLDQGFIRVIDYMGGDESIVQAARVSYGKGTKKISKDRSLIRYLMRNKHTSPFEMCEIKFHIRVPMDAWRQWIRHRTANVNEYSTRYSIAIKDSQKTDPDKWRKQSSTNKQGSTDFFDKEIGAILTKEEKNVQDLAKKVYSKRIESGVAREQARKDLTLSTYTEAYWKIDLHNLLHFLSLRMDSKAQLEIRSYANIIGYEILKKWCPLTWEAFLDYRFNNMSLSDTEVKFIELITNQKNTEVIDLAIELGFLNSDKTIRRSRERLEFEVKLKRLGIPIPW